MVAAVFVLPKARNDLIDPAESGTEYPLHRKLGARVEIGIAHCHGLEVFLEGRGPHQNRCVDFEVAVVIEPAATSPGDGRALAQPVGIHFWTRLTYSLVRVSTFKVSP
jgi:hypothetical protein